jgi:hypothetical protein
MAALCMVLIWLWLAVYATRHAHIDTATIIFIWIGEGLALLFWWRGALFPYVESSPERLIIQNPTEKAVISWAQIETIKPGWGGLRIIHVDGSVTSAWAIQKTNYARLAGQRTRADDVIDKLMDRVNVAGIPDPHAGPVIGSLSDDRDQFWSGTAWVSTRSSDGKSRWSGQQWVQLDPPPESSA